jgi:membrane protein implicated in regulation of membrane protease activity
MPITDCATFPGEAVHDQVLYVILEDGTVWRGYYAGSFAFRLQLALAAIISITSTWYLQMRLRRTHATPIQPPSRSQ